VYGITFTEEKERGFKLLTVQSVFMRSFGHQEKLTGIKIKKSHDFAPHFVGKISI